MKLKFIALFILTVVMSFAAEPPPAPLQPIYTDFEQGTSNWWTVQLYWIAEAGANTASLSYNVYRTQTKCKDADFSSVPNPRKLDSAVATYTDGPLIVPEFGKYVCYAITAVLNGVEGPMSPKLEIILDKDHER